MTELEESIKQEISRLEDRAAEIEDLYIEFMSGVDTYKTESPFGGKAGPFWEVPSEELESIQRDVLQKYEIWYNSAFPLVKEYIPERVEDFTKLYNECTERLKLDNEASSNVQKVINKQNQDFDTQRSILQSISSKVSNDELRARKQISENVAQNELSRARLLFDENEIRAGGVIAGVALERYLLMLCENSKKDINYSYRDGVSTLAQKLYEADEIDSTTGKHLQHLADIRADCAHANEDDPERNNVRRLLEDVEDYVRGRKI